MGAKNIAVYHENNSVAEILALLRDAMVNQLGFTLLEDSISGNNFFVVQHQGSSKVWSRMILKVQYLSSSGDWISFTPVGQWVAGSPGKGYWVIPYNDPDVATTVLDHRYHSIVVSTASEGGVFYLDCDAADGSYFVAQSARYTSSDAWEINNITTAVLVCSQESEYVPNYGLVTYHNSGGIVYQLEASNNSSYACWSPPYGHNWSVCKDGPYERYDTGDPAAYLLFGQYAPPIGGNSPMYWGPQFRDTYSGEKLAVPLTIVGTQTGFQYPRQAPGAVFGARGFAKKVLGYGMALAGTGRYEAQRFVVNHGGQQYMCVVMGKVNGISYHNVPLMLVPLDPEFVGYLV